MLPTAWASMSAPAFPSSFRSTSADGRTRQVSLQRALIAAAHLPVWVGKGFGRVGNLGRVGVRTILIIQGLRLCPSAFNLCIL